MAAPNWSPSRLLNRSTARIRWAIHGLLLSRSSHSFTSTHFRRHVTRRSPSAARANATQRPTGLFLDRLPARPLGWTGDRTADRRRRVYPAPGPAGLGAGRG